jgi:hypothetical protein
MNTMLEARMVAAKIQRPADFVHGFNDGLPRITPSSHGCCVTTIMLLLKSE